MTDKTEDNEPLTIEQQLRIELDWVRLALDNALAELKYTKRRCTCTKCVDAPLD